MEHSMPDINNTCPSINAQRKNPNNTVSWLGFGFSLFVFLLLLLTYIIGALIAKNTTDVYGNGAVILMMLFFMIGIPIGLAGLVLSIVGLIKASNYGGKKWVGICGLIFSGLSVISIFISILINAVSISQPTMETIPAVVDTENQEYTVILLIEGNQLSCYDNRKAQDDNPYQTHIEYVSQIRDEFEVWFTMHNIPEGEPVILKVSNDTDYTQVHDVLMALQLLDMTNYELVNF